MVSRDFGHVIFPRNTFSCAAIKLTFGRNRSGKRTVYNLQTRIYFQKKLSDQVDKIIDQLHLSKCIPNVSLKFISCQGICK